MADLSIRANRDQSMYFETDIPQRFFASTLAILFISRCRFVCPLSTNIEACSLCQFLLAVVKGPKSLCLEFESAGDV